jgi:hypothetical protein
MAEAAWCVVVVRAWREGRQTRVRLLRTGSAGDKSAVEASADDACRRLRSWLAALAPEADDCLDVGDDVAGDENAT